MSRQSRWLPVLLVYAAWVQILFWKCGQAEKNGFCRPDLPGCCPKVVEHVLLLHIEKTGGTSLRTFLQSAVKRRFKQGAICNYLKHMPYQCQPSSAAGGNATCNARNFAYYARSIATGDHFRRPCRLTCSHHDFRIIDALPPSVRNTTLLIVNLREPASRAVSHFHMLRRHGEPGALTAASVVDFFLRDPAGESISRNRMTRVLAGEFCCKDGVPVSYESPELLARAAARLEQFCVVGLTSRVQDTMRYVQHALGLAGERPPKNLHYHNNAKNYEPVEAAVLAALREGNGLDAALYGQAERRFAEQMAAIGRPAEAEGVGAGGELAGPA